MDLALDAIDPAPPADAQAPSPSPSRGADLDRAVAELADRATAFARTSPREKAELLRAVVPRLLEIAPEMVALSCRAKGIDPTSAQAGEEWLAGPAPVIANARLLAHALEDIAAKGRPRLPPSSIRPLHDRVAARLDPRSAAEGAARAGVEARVLFAEGVGRDDVIAEQAAFYKQADPEGGVRLVLGAGNVASIAPMDVLHTLFVEGKVALLKTSPVTAYLSPLLGRALAPLVDRGFCRIVDGGAEEGAHLVQHASVGSVHLTGSAATHDLLVWGPEGPERDRRKAAGEPILEKPITSELGNISPVMIVPCLYDEDELWFVARSVASQVANNASFNCNAAKMLVLPEGWAQRRVFLAMLERALAAAPLRQAYFPGAIERHAKLTGERDDAIHVGGTPPAGALPSTLVPRLDPRDAAEPLFSTEPFCGVLGCVAVGSDDPVEFLAEATDFCNRRIWGTLSAEIVIHPLHEEDLAISRALDRALVELRYGTVAINEWPALGYAMAEAPWGGHPSATLADVRSGIGFVHNTRMLARVDKVILKAPLRAARKPAYFYDNERMLGIGKRLAAFHAAPSLGAVAALGWEAIRA